MATTTKKKAASKKKGAKRKIAKTSIKRFDILGPGGASHTKAVMEELRKISERRSTKPTDFRTMAEIRHDLIPVDNFQLQRLLDSQGIPVGCLIQLMGDAKIGKSTFGHYLLGCAVRHKGGPALSVQWRAKQFLPERAKRAFSCSEKQANLMINRVDQATAATLKEMEVVIQDWVSVQRDKLKVPNSVPLTVLCDNVSKLLPASEAEGFVDWDKHMQAAAKKKLKDTGGGSTFTTASWLQAWTRRLGYYMPANNITMIVILDQNDDVDMSGGDSFGGGNTMAEKWATLYNDTHRGGRAIKQMAGLRLIFGYDSQIKHPDNTLRGLTINIRNAGSTFGRPNVIVPAELRTDHTRYDHPEDDYLDPAWHLEDGLAKWFANEGFFGTVVERGRYSSEAIGVTSATAAAFSEAFHTKQNLVEQLGTQLRLFGYSHAVDDAIG